MDKSGCKWVKDAFYSPPKLCNAKTAPGKDYCRKHIRTLKELNKRPPRCVGCGAKDCNCGLPKIKAMERPGRRVYDPG